MGRVDVPNFTDTNTPFEIGKATVPREGSDITLIGTGQMVASCIEAAEVLQAKGISARVLNMSTVKPLDEEALHRAAVETGGIVTAEEHNVISGLGSYVASYLVEHRPVPMKLVGMADVFGESGESDELMIKYGLTMDKIVGAAEEVIRRR